MSKQTAGKDRVTIIMLMLGVFFLAISGYDTPQMNHAEAALSQSPRLEIEEQADSPLYLTFVKAESPTAYTTEVELSALNTSSKPITAYAIRHKVMLKRWENGGSSFARSISPGSVFQPGQTRSLSFGGGAYYSEPVKAISVSVDFVEFVDGTRWGKDSYRSGEHLDGMRAGGWAASRYLNNLFKEGGVAAVTNVLETEAESISSPDDRSPRWKEGFRTGINIFFDRIKHAYNKGGSVELEAALGQPVDAYEGLKRKRGGDGNGTLQ